MGCQAGQMPNAPELPPGNTATVSQVQSPSLRIALIPFALRKSAGEQTSSKVKTKIIGQRGGRLTLTHEKTHTQFVVLPRALDANTNISMQIHGSGPSSIIEFGPDGTQFNLPCLLSITFPADGIDPASLGGYLLQEEGPGTPIQHRIFVKNNRITVVMLIRHFSEYYVDDNEPPEEDLDLIYDDWEPEP